MKIGSLRLVTQFVLGGLLNFTVIGGLMVAPFLPILRLTSVVRSIAPTENPGEMHLCPLGVVGRCLTGTWPVVLLVPVLLGVALVCLAVGRMLCGWACPFGLVQDLFVRIRNWRFSPRELPGSLHERLLSLKYVLLFLFTMLAVALGASMVVDRYAGTLVKECWPTMCQASPYCVVCFPMGASGAAELLRSFSLSTVGPWTALAFLVWAIFLIGAARIPRFWCRYFCWVGAVSSMASGVSLVALRKDTDRCNHCGYCQRACAVQNTRPMDEMTTDRVSDANCVLCLDCIEACPAGALSLCAGKRRIFDGGKPWWKRS